MIDIVNTLGKEQLKHLTFRDRKGRLIEEFDLTRMDREPLIPHIKSKQFRIITFTNQTPSMNNCQLNHSMKTNIRNITVGKCPKQS